MSDTPPFWVLIDAQRGATFDVSTRPGEDGEVRIEVTRPDYVERVIVYVTHEQAKTLAAALLTPFQENPA